MTKKKELNDYSTTDNITVVTLDKWLVTLENDDTLSAEDMDLLEGLLRQLASEEEQRDT